MLRIFFWTCILVFAVCPAAAAADRPETALSEIQKAVDSRDMELLEKRMDMDALLDQGLKVFFATMQGNAASLPPALALMASTADTPQLQKSLGKLLKDETKKFVRYGVESGHFAGKPDSQARPSGLMGALLSEASLGRKTLKAAGTSRIEGSSAKLRAQLHDDGNGRDYPLDLRLTLRDGVWQVTGVDNLEQLTGRLYREAVQER